MKQIIGIADMKVSNSSSDILITYALGSCLGITVYDCVARVGGMLHIMLPLSTNNATKAAENPLMFVDTGVPQLFKACYNLGAKKERLVLKVAGGATLRQNHEEDQFQIGKRNIMMLKKLLWKNNVIIHSEHVGEHFSRTMAMDISNGEVTLKINNDTSVRL